MLKMSNWNNEGHYAFRIGLVNAVFLLQTKVDVGRDPKGNSIAEFQHRPKPSGVFPLRWHRKLGRNQRLDVPLSLQSHDNYGTGIQLIRTKSIFIGVSKPSN